MRASLALVSCLAFVACTGGNAKPEIWIYSSTYKEVLALYEPYLERAFPEVKIEWYQAGSENVAARLNAEIVGGGTKADLVMTSDIFYFQELKKQGLLMPLQESADLAKLPPGDVDPQRMFAVTRFPMMVLAYNKDAVQKNPALLPTSFKDLGDPKFKGRITMPSPLESGSTLCAVLYLYKLYGRDWFAALRRNDILSAGGNGASMARMLSGEKPVGMVLMENVLQSREKGKLGVEYVVPSEGALPIPSPVAIFKSTRHPEIAQRVFRWFLSQEAQEVLVKGWVYSPFRDAAPPRGGPPWKQLRMQPWSLPVLEGWGAERQAIKELFQESVLK